MTQPLFPGPYFPQFDDLTDLPKVDEITNVRLLVDAKVDAVVALTEAAATRFRGTNAPASDVLKFLETWRDAMTSL